MPVVLVEKKGPRVTVLTLNRPERRNALSLQLLTELIAAIKMASDEPQERVLVLRGAGAAFCTGLDLKEASDHTKGHATADLVATALITLSETRLVTIAAELLSSILKGTRRYCRRDGLRLRVCCGRPVGMRYGFRRLTAAAR